MSHRLVVRTALVVALFAALSGAYFLGAQDTDKEKNPERTLKSGQVMKVGSEIITAEDLLGRIWDYEQALPKERRYMLDSLMYLRDMALLRLEAKRIGVEVTDEEVETETDKQLKFVKSEVKRKTMGTMTFQQWLQQQGLTEDGFRKYLSARAKTILLKRLLVHYFRNTTESLDGQHIIVKKRALADDIYKRLEAGSDFGDLAVKYSAESSAGINKGKLPRIYKNDGTLIKEVADELWSLKDGEYSKPFNSDYGYHIVRRIKAYPPARSESFAQMRAWLFKQPNIPESWFTQWVSWVLNTQKYPVETRIPGYEVEPNQ